MKSTVIRHEQLSPLQHQQLLEIELLSEQKTLVGDAYGAVHTLTARPACDIQGYVLLIEDVPVGFFLLKRRSLLPRWADGPTATLHALMIDRRYQGLGLGRTCVGMLPGLVRGFWPDIEQLMLAVDLGNLPARALYQSLGWQECGDADRTRTGFERRMVLSLG
ncbi:GNAT family N-acetyltransferase [Pseudomonas sp. NPDC087358]|uniref:GNAT family N-acetyltransferase n=1 Tax=Pseudomonas sp. NPDC087358 TaxID=3364439 RepID=UPI00384D767E